MAAVLILLGCTFAGRAADEESESALFADCRARFAPAKATVRMTYSAGYRLCGLLLKEIAVGEVATTEGTWQGADGRPVRVAVLEWKTHAGKTPDARIRINDRLLSVVSMPDLNTLMFVRRVDQTMRPVLRKERHNCHEERFDMQGGTLSYFHTNLVTGSSSTNIPGGADMARQGREVAELIKVLAQVNRGDRPMLEIATSPRLFVDIERHVQTFAMKTSREEAPVRYPVHEPMSLRADVVSAPESEWKKGRLVMWSLSLRDLAKAADQSDIPDLAADVIDFMMVPLAIDYDLALGSVRVTLSSFTVDAARPVEQAHGRMPVSMPVSVPISMPGRVPG